MEERKSFDSSKSQDNKFLCVPFGYYPRRHSDLPPRPKIDTERFSQSVSSDFAISKNNSKLFANIDSRSRRDGARRVTDGGQTSGLLLHNYPRRRESFLYRSDSDVDTSTRSSRNHSLTGEESSIGHSEEMIITPFAQILSSLKKIRVNFTLLTNVSGIKSNKENDTGYTSSKEDILRNISIETLEELEWCLNQLEKIHTSQSVSNLASLKFRKILSKELSLTEGQDKTNKQVSEYIFQTFLEESELLPIIHQGRYYENSMSIYQMENALYSSMTLQQRRLIEKFLDSNSYEWNMDVFFLNEITNSRPLCFVAYHIFKTLDLFSKFQIDVDHFLRVFQKIESKYSTEIPYHNNIHAADVTHTTFVLLSTTALRNVFTDLEVMAIIIASAIHDIDHPGLTNQFLINTNDKLAILYNDLSILENHHLAVAFKLFHEDDYSIFSSLDRKSMQNLRKLIIDMVIATDMSKHMSLLADLKTLVETKKVAGSSVITMEHYTERMQVLQIMIHCSDLSNPTKCLSTYQKWVDRIMEEFFRQGDREKQLGIDVSPMCDRDCANVAMSQVSFIDYIVHPLWETWTDLVYPDSKSVIDTLEENRTFYQSNVETAVHLSEQ